MKPPTPPHPRGLSKTLPFLATLLGCCLASKAASVGLAWDPNPESDLAGYRLFRGTASGVYNWTNDVGLTTSVSVDGLSNGVNYFFVLKAYNGSGLLSGPSNEITYTPSGDSTPPSIPSGLAASLSGLTQINITWLAATDNVAVAGYRLERSQGAGSTAFSQVASPTGTSYSDSNLSPSTVYNYRVRAVDSSGNVSGYSSVLTATTPADTTPPSTPSGLLATAANSGQINLGWSACTDNVGVTGYLLERSQGSGSTSFAQIATPSSTTHSDTGLMPGTVYNYRLRSRDAAGCLSPYSAIVSATTPTVSASGLVVALAFDEGTGTSTTDASGTGNVGQLLGATWSASGKYGAAVSFDGLNDMVQIADAANLDLGAAMTLEAWVRPASAQTGWRSIIHRDVDTYWLYAGCSDSQALIPAAGATINSSVPTVIAPSGIAASSWTHLATTYDGTRVRLFVNGAEVAGVNQTGSILANGEPVQIGGNTYYGEFFSGLIDEVRIYNRALSAAEIQADMATPIGGTPPVNQRPTAVAQSRSLAEDGSLSIVLSGSDPEGSALTYAVSRAPTNGTLSGTAPTLLYRPDTNYFGADSLEFTVSDGSLVSAPATVSLNVTAVNDRPVAVAQSLSVPAAGSVAVTLQGSDVEGGALTFAVSRSPSKGTLSGTGPNLVYSVTAGATGTDTFEFTVGDGSSTSVPATVTLVIQPANQRPTAIAQSVSVAEDGSVAISLTGSDPEGAPLVHAIVRPPAKGTLSGTAPNLVYRPATNFFGTDSLEFTVSDGSLVSTAATVSITVNPVNDAPVAFAQTVSVAEDTALNLVLTASDPEGDALTFAVTVNPTQGTISGTSPNFVYRPNTNYSGTDSLQFTARDASLTSVAATVSITVTAVDDPPVAVAQSLTLSEDGSRTITLSGSDPEGSSLTYQITQQPAKGTLTGTPPSLTYRPVKDFNGTDSFRFTVGDGQGTSSPATVSLTVSAVNDRPVAQSQSVTVPKGGSVSVVLSGTDVDGDALTYTVSTMPTMGTLSGTAPNLVYKPTAGFAGSDSFRFKVKDRALTSTAATVSITVVQATMTESDLVIVATGGTTDRVATSADTLTANDAVSGPYSVQLTSEPAYGEVSVEADGRFLYRHHGDVGQDDAFTYVVSKDGVTSPETTVRVHAFSISSLEKDGADNLVRFPVVAGLNYTVEVNDSTPNPAAAWMVLDQFVADADGTMVVRDTGGATTPARFYRVKLVGDDVISITEPWGSQNVGIVNRAGGYGSPFQGQLRQRGTVTAVSADGLELAGASWPAEELGPRDGYPSHVVMVHRQRSGGTSVGDWWPIVGQSGATILVGNRGESLQTRIQPYDLVDIIRLQSVADVFGSATDPARSLLPGDSIQLLDEANTLRVIDYRAGQTNAPGYYVSRLGVVTGPFDGTTLTLSPSQAINIRRLSGAPSLRFAGRVQTTPLSRYFSAGYTMTANAFPVALPISDAGLVESGWISDGNGVPRAVEEDLLYLNMLDGRMLQLAHCLEADGTGGWYSMGSYPGSQMANDCPIAPGRAIWLLIKSRPNLFRWSQPLPW